MKKQSETNGFILMATALLVFGLIGYFYLWLVPFIIKYMLSIWGITVALKQVQITMACIYGLALAFKPSRGDK